MIEEVAEGILLRLPVNDDRELVMKILQYGSMARVVEPEALRQRIHNEAKSIAAQYEPAPHPAGEKISRPDLLAK